MILAVYTPPKRPPQKGFGDMFRALYRCTEKHMVPYPHPNGLETVMHNIEENKKALETTGSKIFGQFRKKQGKKCKREERKRNKVN